MKFKNDPLGAAIWDFHQNLSSGNIIVESDLCDDDIIPVQHLFRSEAEMSVLDIKALKESKGKILDVGAAAGCHSSLLQKRGFDITALDTSAGACSYLKELGIPTINLPIEQYQDRKYDTILLLMNGLGLSGTRKNLVSFLHHLKSLLNPGGQILADSADISYLFEDEDGGVWVDLNTDYFGEMKFNMKYKDQESGWFDWVYFDQNEAQKAGEKAGLKSVVLSEGSTNNFLLKYTL